MNLGEAKATEKTKTTEETQTNMITEKGIRRESTEMEVKGITESFKTTGTAPTVHFDLDKSNDLRATTTVIVLVITSFIIGISFGLCCVWFIFLRRSQKKNKVRPSSGQNDVEVNILRSERSKDVDVTECDKSKLFKEKRKTDEPRKTFHVSNVRFEFNEVEI